MFRFNRSLDTITLFHRASSPASVRLAAALKELALRSEAGTEGALARGPFELDVTEDLPTADQVKTILEYVGPSQISKVVRDSATVKDALEKYSSNRESFHRPLVVDWNNGKATTEDSESAILTLLNQTKQ